MKNKLTLVLSMGLLTLVGCGQLQDSTPILDNDLVDTQLDSEVDTDLIGSLLPDTNIEVTTENETLTHYETNEDINENVLALEKALVTRVIDGDTVELENGERVRFIGVDSPERGEPGFDEATEFTRAAIEGEIVWLERDGDDTDRFGRLRRYVWVSQPTDIEDELQVKEKMLNAQLLLNGYAEVAIFGTPRLATFFRTLAN